MIDKTHFIVSSFVEFLNSSLKTFDKLGNAIENQDYYEDLRNDFFQANWEILVESVICIPGKEFLDTYGEGADCNGASSRVCFPNKLPTHRIKIVGATSSIIVDEMSKKEIDLENCTLYSFVHFENGDWSYESPINAVLLENDIGYSVVKLEDVVFKKSKIESKV